MPVKELKNNLRAANCVSEPKEEGMGPVNEEIASANHVSAVMLPIDEGMVPESEFP